MYTGLDNLSDQQRTIAIQRLTALWAFTESGLGGIMHALKIPFTGLTVGGMAVVMICMIAYLSAHQYRLLLKSACIVILVKAMVSPHTPVTAYLAVSFQALAGYALFSLFRVNLISILLFSIIAMLESAFQKLLVLTLFFGESIWKAFDKTIAWISTQFGRQLTDGSFWIISLYLFMYLAGAILIAWLAWHTIKSFDSHNRVFVVIKKSAIQSELQVLQVSKKKNKYKKILLAGILLLFISIALFFLSPSKSQGWIAVGKTITRALLAITIWYALAGPILTKIVQQLLRKKQSRYSEEVLNTISFLPVMKQITAIVWQQSKIQKDYNKWYFSFMALIHTVLTYTEPEPDSLPANEPI